MSPGSLSVAILALPLVAALLVGRVRDGARAHGLAAVLMGVAAVLAALLALDVVGGDLVVQGPHATWLDLGAFTLGVGTFIDPMAAVMTLIVTVLATAVLVFNAWYMHDDRLAARFPWQFCWFVAAMLGVVLSDNLFLSFVCWELVGLGSYLLIGFWFDKPAAADDADYQARKGGGARGVNERELSPAYAQRKAFVMNRVGDAGFLVGIGALLAAALLAGRGGDLLAFHQRASLPAALTAADVATRTFCGFDGSALLLLGALGILCGAIGKSAQFPLQGWLPDAMQGPTTASSIIHAATMVAAGVYLIARCYPLFPPEALAVVGWTGGITCLLAATIACVQWDLKAVLAYSTVSQLGLMFVGLGAGAAAGGKDAAMAHLFTHAFAKCLLFLCAGAVIHACEGHQDLHRMGGLRKHMPVTAAVSLLALLALCGMPLLSGFVSKDAVLAASLEHAHAHGGAAWGPFLLACLGSLLTAAYMLRWWLRIFAGASRDQHVGHHAHDPSTTAKGALLVLAPALLGFPWTIGNWLPLPHAPDAHTPAMVVALVLFAVGGGTALLVYGRGGVTAGDALANALRPLHTACSELWWLDKLNHRLFQRGLGSWLAGRVARVDLGGDQRLAALEKNEDTPAHPSLDGFVDAIGRTFAGLGRGSSWFHRGRLGVYLALAFGLGALGLLLGGAP